MNEKDFCSFSQSKRLQELGLNYDCFAIYYDGLLVNQPSTLGILKCTPAPLRYQAFKFFREKYNIQHEIWSGNIEGMFYGYLITDENGEEISTCGFDTYEESESACIDKLYEIFSANDTSVESNDTNLQGV